MALAVRRGEPKGLFGAPEPEPFVYLGVHSKWTELVAWLLSAGQKRPPSALHFFRLLEQPDLRDCQVGSGLQDDLGRRHADRAGDQTGALRQDRLRRRGQAVADRMVEAGERLSRRRGHETPLSVDRKRRVHFVRIGLL